MSVVLDVTAILVGSLSATKLYTWNLTRKSKYKEPSSHKWLWSNEPYYRGFQCPVCSCTTKNIEQPPYCTCLEFPRDHFHFKCVDCKYVCIMRTFNDPIDNRKWWKLWISD